MLLCLCSKWLNLYLDYTHITNVVFLNSINNKSEVRRNIYESKHIAGFPAIQTIIIII